jgi:FKBP-type peptidyl-prolyl cis-trans isomerase SlyD
MRIGKDRVVTIDYTLRDEAGDVLDSSEEDGALSYIHGSGFLVPGVESILEGKSAGDVFQVAVSPEEGYGVRDEALVLSVDRSALDCLPELKEGTRFQIDAEEGPRVFAVVTVEPERVLVDGNHPLAGMVLSFDIAVREVREATEEELEHGHVHG